MKKSIEMKCPLCEMPFTELKRFVEHARRRCILRRGREDELEAYIQEIKPAKNDIRCQTCKKEYKNARRLNEHIKRAHKKERPLAAPAPFACLCGKSYQSKQSLSRHLKTHKSCGVVCATAVKEGRALIKKTSEGTKRFTIIEREPELIRPGKRPRVECKCGLTFISGQAGKHERSKKHIAALGEAYIRATQEILLIEKRLRFNGHIAELAKFERKIASFSCSILKLLAVGVVEQSKSNPACHKYHAILKVKDKTGEIKVKIYNNDSDVLPDEYLCSKSFLFVDRAVMKKGDAIIRNEAAWIIYSKRKVLKCFNCANAQGVVDALTSNWRGLPMEIYKNTKLGNKTLQP